MNLEMVDGGDACACSRKALGGSEGVFTDHYIRVGPALSAPRPFGLPSGDDDAPKDNFPDAIAVGGGAKKDGDDSVLKNMGTDTSECSEAAKRTPGTPCSSKKVVMAMGEFVIKIGNGTQSTAPPPVPPPPPPVEGVEVLPNAPSDDAEAVRKAAETLGCTSESCVISHPKFRHFIATEGAGLENFGGVAVLDAELDRRFKPKGPRDSTQLLSNFNLDGVLQQWASTAFPTFYNYSFNMMDFEETGGTLARTDVAGILEGHETQNLGKMGGHVKRPCDTFACVLNTDVSSGRGKHWVAVFGDCRGKGEWTVEYFNSAGNPPPAPVTRWLEESAARLMGHRASHPGQYGEGAVTPVTLTDMRHQTSQTECGLYALYFIRRRLEGTPYKDFQETHIPDEAMMKFRKHVFRAT